MCSEDNLRDAYDTFADLEAACEAFCDLVNSRPHRVTRRAPVEMLAEERLRLHPVASAPFTVAFGTTRVVPDNTPMVNFEHGQYSVPHRLCGATVWVRVHGRGADEQIVICHLTDTGPVEVARHRRATPGTPILDDTHFPPAPAGALERTPRAKTVADSEFLALGEGARIWLVEAAAAGAGKMRVKMAAAVQLARLFNPADVDWALGHAAVHGRFAEADLASILDHHRNRPNPTQLQASEDKSLTQGTRGWAGQTAPVAGVPVAPPLPADLEALLRRMRLPYMRTAAPDILATARAQRWDPAEIVKALLVEEVTGRERSALTTRRTAAGFPTGKTFDAWQPTASSIPAPTQQALRTLEWVGRRENLVVCGPSGTGKTFFLEALGHLAVEQGLRVAWFTLEDLGLLLRRHRADDTVSKAIARILRADLVVVDDIGLLPVSHDAAEGLYRLVDAAYEKRSVAISSNLHPAGFDELMPKTLATATVDRLLHHAHVCQTSGDSVRLTQALAGRGVTPLH